MLEPSGEREDHANYQLSRPSSCPPHPPRGNWSRRLPVPFHSKRCDQVMIQVHAYPWLACHVHALMDLSDHSPWRTPCSSHREEEEEEREREIIQGSESGRRRKEERSERDRDRDKIAVRCLSLSSRTLSQILTSLTAKSTWLPPSPSQHSNTRKWKSFIDTNRILR